MTLSSYVKKRPGSEHWQLRVPVPKDVQPAYGKKEVTRSLREKDRGKADDEAIRILAGLKREWELLRTGPHVPTVEELHLTAVEWGFDQFIEFLNKNRVKQRGASITDWSDFVASQRGRLELRAQQVATGDISPIEATARRIIDRLGWMLPKGSAAYTSFCAQLAAASLDAMNVGAQRNAGRMDAEPTSRVVLDAQAKRERTASVGQTIAELFERYAEQRMAEKRKRLDTVNQDRKVIEQFAGFVGDRRAPRSITRDDIRDWRDTVAALPANYRKMKAYRGLNMRQVATKARADGVKGMSPITLNKYLSTVSPLFDWMRTTGYTDTNPCDGLFYKLTKGGNPYPPFSTDQLNTMLGSPLFTGFLRDGREHEPGKVEAGDWRFWIPLVCLFSGARIGEIAQLRVEDVKREHGVWFLHIRDDESTGQSTKSRQSRPMPVHSILEAMGFLAFHERQVERAARDGNAQLFPELKPNDRDQISGKPSRFWREYLDAIGVKNGGDGFGSHSFRHTLADQLRMAGFLDNQIKVALGHSDKTTTSGYGRLTQGTVTMFRDMIEAVKFEEVDFTGLIEKAKSHEP